MSRILVVEDDAIIGADIQRTLQRLGYDVPAMVDNAEDALRSVRTDPPDLVLMDIQLRGAEDGVEATTQIRRASDVPVVYLTAHSDEATLARARATGPHGYVIKPFNERDLRTAIEVAIGKHEIERQLSERERWFSTTLRSLGDAVIATDPSERITFMNTVAQQLTGFTGNSALGRPLREVLRLVDIAGTTVKSPVAEALHSGFAAALPFDTQLIDRHGVSRDIDDAATPIVDDRGALLGGVIVFRDVTDQKRLERRLETAQRVASLCTMAAGIAHEINNPLAITISNVAFVEAEMEIARSDLATAPEGARWMMLMDGWLEALKDASAGAERVRKVVATMRSLSGLAKPSREILDVTHLLEQALKLTNVALRQKARLVRAYGTTPFVHVDENQLVGVFVTLLDNAAEAIDEGAPETNEIRLSTYTDDAGRAVIEVTDTGKGIPRAQLTKIFDPFFSTKGLGAGMGVGLSVSHTFVAAAGGELTVESEVGRGTTFRVSLPAADAAQIDPTRETTPHGTGRARVLVVDDEVAVVKAVSRVLREHDVHTETDSRAALARLLAGDSFDVILCDLMMPHITGSELHDQLVHARPELAAKIVFLTGGAMSKVAEEFLAQTPRTVLEKPFSARELRELVASRSLPNATS